MKKFDRLPPEKRKEEIRTAALELFNEKGFAATTMENIVERVSLSKGGVYRIYPSTLAILSDLMLQGMRMRNGFYAQKAQELLQQEKRLTLPALVDMILDSLLLYPDFSRVYVEFLWEKRRNPQLELLYCEICASTVEDTMELIRSFGAEDLVAEPGLLPRLTELMNAAILSIHTLDLGRELQDNREGLRKAVLMLLVNDPNGIR